MLEHLEQLLTLYITTIERESSKAPIQFQRYIHDARIIKRQICTNHTRELLAIESRA